MIHKGLHLWHLCGKVSGQLHDVTWHDMTWCQAKSSHSVCQKFRWHYTDFLMGPMASQITSLTIVYSTANSGGDQRKHQSSASLTFVQGIHRWSVNSPHKWPVTRNFFPFDDVIMGRTFMGLHLRSYCDLVLITTKFPSRKIITWLCGFWREMTYFFP